MLEKGKIPNDILQSIILNQIRKRRKEVVIGPGIGEDCCAVEFGDNLCVLTTDPITGTSHEVGKLAVHVSCNDLASSGVEPLGLLVSLLVPVGSTKEQLEKIFRQITNTAASLNIEIMGGHTEVTDAVTRFVVSVTAMGKIRSSGFIKTSGAKPGNDLVMTKYAGLEGTAIIAFENMEELSERFGSPFVIMAKKRINEISVVKEGLIAAQFGATAMHDVTEGGVYGAVWEISKSSDCGVELYKDKIPVMEVTNQICNYYNISPYQLISSGSMLIACSDGERMVKQLEGQKIPAFIIGKFTSSKNRILVTESGGIFIPLPKGDELYKVKKRC